MNVYSENLDLLLKTVNALIQNIYRYTIEGLTTAQIMSYLHTIYDASFVIKCFLINKGSFHLF